jgi:hypothetical protein
MTYLDVGVAAPVLQETAFKSQDGTIRGTHEERAIDGWHCSSAPSLSVADQYPLQWNGAAFSSRHTTSDAYGLTKTVEMEGTVSPAGDRLIRLTCRRENTNASSDSTETRLIELSDIPLAGRDFFEISGLDVRQYVSGADHVVDTPHSRWQFLSFQWDWEVHLATLSVAFVE